MGTVRFLPSRSKARSPYRMLSAGPRLIRPLIPLLAQLGRLCVLPESRKYRLGASLVRAVKDYAVRAGMERGEQEVQVSCHAQVRRSLSQSRRCCTVHALTRLASQAYVVGFYEKVRPLHPEPPPLSVLGERTDLLPFSRLQLGYRSVGERFLEVSPHSSVSTLSAPPLTLILTTSTAAGRHGTPKNGLDGPHLIPRINLKPLR